MRFPCIAVYILTNCTNRVLYVGVTANLASRLAAHRAHQDPLAFTARYNVFKLLYYEPFDRIQDAIRREKQLKAGSRSRKLRLIQGLNPQWRDLGEDLV